MAHLISDVGEADWEVDREDNQNDVTFWVTEWP